MGPYRWREQKSLKSNIFITMRDFKVFKSFPVYRSNINQSILTSLLNIDKICRYGVDKNIRISYLIYCHRVLILPWPRKGENLHEWKWKKSMHITTAAPTLMKPDGLSISPNNKTCFWKPLCYTKMTGNRSLHFPAIKYKKRNPHRKLLKWFNR